MQRIERIENFIKESRADMQLSALSAFELVAVAEQWEKRFAVIPDEMLERVFNAVIESHDSRAPISASEVLSVWNNLRPKTFTIERKALDTSDCIHRCFDGWMIFNSDGSRWKGGDQTTYVKACPVHRSFMKAG